MCHFVFLGLMSVLQRGDGMWVVLMRLPEWADAQQAKV